MTDLEKRAEQIRKELSIEDKTNLVAQAIIELVKENRKLITYTDICNKIQNYLGLECQKEQYIIGTSRFVSKNITNDFNVVTFFVKIIGLCLKRNLIGISICVIDKNGNFQLDGFKGGYKVNGAEYNGNIEKDQKETLKKICNGEYNFLLKPIPILEKIKVENLIDEETANIKDENERKNARELGNEQTVYARANFPSEEINKIHRRAQNKCEFCECQTFEKKNGEMYFEIHHIVHYSDGGENSSQNCVLLCPNCHRKIHFAKKEIVNEMERTLKRKVKNNF